MSHKATSPYPFPFSAHTLWIMRQLIDIPRTWNLHDNKFFVETFSSEFPPSIENDFYTCEILKYLRLHKVIKVYTDGSENIEEFKLPIPGNETHRMVVRWQVSISNSDTSFIIRLHNKIVHQIKLEQQAKFTKLNCSFFISEDYLYIRSDIGDYPLRKFNTGLTAHTVMLALCEYGKVTLNAKNEIDYPLKYSRIKVASLQEVLRGVGFDKMLKQSFFVESTATKATLKQMPLQVPKPFLLHLIAHFEEASKIRSHINHTAKSKRKITTPNRVEVASQRDLNPL